MHSKIRSYYATGNTAIGFYSLYESVLHDLEKVYVLKGAPGTGKSTCIRSISRYLIDEGYHVEWIHSPADNDSLDGLVIRQLRVGIINGSGPPQGMDPFYPGAVGEIVNLGEYWDESLLRQAKKEIMHLTDRVQSAFKKSYQHFAKAKEIHLERERVYSKGMNVDKINQATETLIKRIFAGEPYRYADPFERHLFFGAATPSGVVNFIDDLTEECSRRVIMKGRPGAGKSTLLKKLVDEAHHRGLSSEVYHCGFDPQSLDMVLFPQLKCVVMDGTSPHEIEPTRDGDEIFDMYELCFDIDIDNEYALLLEDSLTRYKSQTKQGIQCLREAKQHREKLEPIYTQAMNFQQVNQKRDEVLEEILSIRP